MTTMAEQQLPSDLSTMSDLLCEHCESDSLSEEGLREIMIDYRRDYRSQEEHGERRMHHTG